MASDDKALGCSALAAIAECDACEKAAIYSRIDTVSCVATCAVESATCAACSAQEALSCVCDYATTIDTLACSVQELNTAIEIINCNVADINTNITSIVNCLTCVRHDLDTVIGADTGCSMRTVAGEVYDCCSQ